MQPSEWAQEAMERRRREDRGQAGPHYLLRLQELAAVVPVGCSGVAGKGKADCMLGRLLNRSLLDMKTLNPSKST